MKRFIAVLGILFLVFSVCAFADTGPAVSPAAQLAFPAGTIVIAPELEQLASPMMAQPVRLEAIRSPAVGYLEIPQTYVGAWIALLLLISAFLILLAVSVMAALQQWGDRSGLRVPDVPKSAAGFG